MKDIKVWNDLDSEVQEAFAEFKQYFVSPGLVFRGFRILFKNGINAVSVFSEWSDVDDFEIMNIDSETLRPFGEVIRTDLEDGLETIRTRLRL